MGVQIQGGPVTSAWRWLCNPGSRMEVFLDASALSSPSSLDERITGVRWWWCGGRIGNEMLDYKINVTLKARASIFFSRMVTPLRTAAARSTSPEMRIGQVGCCLRGRSPRAAACSTELFQRKETEVADRKSCAHLVRVTMTILQLGDGTEGPTCQIWIITVGEALWKRGELYSGNAARAVARMERETANFKGVCRGGSANVEWTSSKNSPMGARCKKSNAESVRKLSSSLQAIQIRESALEGARKDLGASEPGSRNKTRAKNFGTYGIWER
ncbi:hypothetical protein C8R44DRAFT_725121 [Mycena epipterygia]|nr:hypothetical protein C8R44DRAFT_725121 [Mycena epipterygia]